MRKLLKFQIALLIVADLLLTAILIVILMTLTGLEPPIQINCEDLPADPVHKTNSI